MNPKPFDPTKPVQTRDGRKARIICTDRVWIGGAPLVVLIDTIDGSYQDVECFWSDGRIYSSGADSQCDLFNAPEPQHEPVTLWVNAHASGGSGIYTSGPFNTEEYAIRTGGNSRDYVGTIPITIPAEIVTKARQK